MTEGAERSVLVLKGGAEGRGGGDAVAGPIPVVGVFGGSVSERLKFGNMTQSTSASNKITTGHRMTGRQTHIQDGTRHDIRAPSNLGKKA